MIDPELLTTYVAIADAGSFSGAARALRCRQSTVSQRIQRLEAATGRRLLDRDTHRVALTAEGQVVLDHARQVLDAHRRMARYLSGNPLRGRLRIGTSEDFVLSALPDVLADFVRRYPEVNLELATGLSAELYEAFDAGSLDVLFVKRRAGDKRGIVGWSEPIVWVGRPGFQLPSDGIIPLLLYPPPSITRTFALKTLEAERRPWRVTFTSASLSGLTAAARAGIGIIPHSARLLPPGLAVLPASLDLPMLPMLEFVFLRPRGRNPLAEALSDAVLQWAASGRGARRLGD